MPEARSLVKLRRIEDVSIALYRRYRPEKFEEVIGQQHVTSPLISALAAGNTTHAYLFSGPRGCGKTTSARILARCLNCAEYPTGTPCGECDSCKELARGGSGSLDVVELDAASHGGVDDARELREQASFAPVRDRYKIFIIDEAHMVTNQGFNALLKLVEEPPPHIKFIFATTEPEKVIGTIRSRTHHYPFRLVPPPILQDYLEQICAAEGIEASKEVLSLVVRAGTGSVRDTLSVLDQIIGGSEGNKLDYDRAVALLGYTSAHLINSAVEAIAARDGAKLFAVVDDIVRSGHDPRRFVEDLLQRFRDLVIIALAGSTAGDVFSSVPEDEYSLMCAEAEQLGARRASQCADFTNEALNTMVGATAPRLQLELLCARLIVEEQEMAAPIYPAAAPAAVGVSVMPVASAVNTASSISAASTLSPAKTMVDPRRGAMPKIPGAKSINNSAANSPLPPPSGAVENLAGSVSARKPGVPPQVPSKASPQEMKEKISGQWIAIKTKASAESPAVASILEKALGVQSVRGGVVNIAFPDLQMVQHFNRYIPALNAVAIAIYQDTGLKMRIAGEVAAGVAAVDSARSSISADEVAESAQESSSTSNLGAEKEVVSLGDSEESTAAGVAIPDPVAPSLAAPASVSADPAGVLGQMLERKEVEISDNEDVPFYAKNMPKLPPLESPVCAKGKAESSALLESPALTAMKQEIVEEVESATEKEVAEEIEVSADDPVIDQSEVVGVKVVLKKFNGKIIGKQSTQDDV